MYFRNAIQSFFWGIITAGMSLVLQLFIISSFLSFFQTDQDSEKIMNSLLFLVIYAFTEEALKYFIILKKINIISYGKTFLLNPWIAGIGFSLVEIFIIYQRNINENIGLSPGEIFQTAPLHILTFGFLGYHIAIKDKKGLDLSALFWIFIIHLSYNYSVINLEKFSPYINFSIIAFLAILNFYYFLTINKKLASD